jgi:peptidoglycan hydrolase-like amidase
MGLIDDDARCVCDPLQQVGMVGESGKKAGAQNAAVGWDWELEPVPVPYLGGVLGNETMTKAAREAAAAKSKAAGTAATTTIGVAGSEGRGTNERKQATHDQAGSSDDEEDEDATVGGVTNKQRALIQAAFVGDDVEGEFAADKAKEVEGELPKVRLMT